MQITWSDYTTWIYLQLKTFQAEFMLICPSTGVLIWIQSFGYAPVYLVQKAFSELFTLMINIKECELRQCPPQLLHRIWVCVLLMKREAFCAVFNLENMLEEKYIYTHLRMNSNTTVGLWWTPSSVNSKFPEDLISCQVLRISSAIVFCITSITVQRWMGVQQGNKCLCKIASVRLFFLFVGL